MRKKKIIKWKPATRHLEVIEWRWNIVEYAGTLNRIWGADSSNWPNRNGFYEARGRHKGVKVYWKKDEKKSSS